MRVFKASKILATLAMFSLLSLLSMSLFAVASAHHNTSHHKGGGDSHEKGHHGDVLTEDNDNDGVSNDPDPYGDSDNRHPSGKDKHAEHGKSGNQGKSTSDPDGDTNGGADKPGGPGGLDTFDQDGNNGCGNDDDFEDDNNGNCGGKKVEECRKALPPQAMGHGNERGTEACEEDALNGETGETSDDDESSDDDETTHGEETTDDDASSGHDDDGISIVKHSGPGVSSGGSSAAVLGSAETSDEGMIQHDVAFALPFTGMSVLGYVLMAMGLIGTGVLLYARSLRTTG